MGIKDDLRKKEYYMLNKKFIGKSVRFLKVEIKFFL